MIGGGSGSGGDGERDGGDRDDGRDEAADSFADMIGEVKALDPKPERAPRSSPNTKPKPRTSIRDRTSSSRFRFPDAERPRLGAVAGVSDRQLQALARGEVEPEERIDLHGIRQDGADRLLSGRLESARAQGLRCVIVIHGQGKRSDTGEAVLRDGLAGWLTGPRCATHVLAFAPAPPRLGGEGATLVLLTREKR